MSKVVQMSNQTGEKIQDSKRSLRKSDEAILKAIFQSVRDKLKYMEQSLRGPMKVRRRKRRTKKARGKEVQSGK